jgi:hypothetical protein
LPPGNALSAPIGHRRSGVGLFYVLQGEAGDRLLEHMSGKEAIELAKKKFVT